jgi:proline iminopeptidase
LTGWGKILVNLIAPQEGYIPVENGELYYRAVGQGKPIVLLHGGPDFDHSYLLPEMDCLANSHRLIYYDQRGRGRSLGQVKPEEVSIHSEIEDLESLRAYFHLDKIAVLGHSWGGLLALEYAVQHPERVSHLILMNTAPASHQDYLLLRQYRLLGAADDIEILKARANDARYQEGDPDTVARYYRIHFSKALKRPEHLEIVIARLRANFTQERILKGREIEDRLLAETWLSDDYDLISRLEEMNIQTLVIHGEGDIVPIECAAHIAEALTGARFVVFKDCGHFAFLESHEVVCEEIRSFLR